MRLRMGGNSAVAYAGDVSTIGIWYKAIRFHFVPPSFLPAILCSLCAWTSGFPVDYAGFVLVIAGVTINHIGLNLLDDICDYLHAVDRSSPYGEKNPYTGGSGVLTEGLLTPAQVAHGAIFCFILTAIIGFHLAWTHGWPVLAFGLFGLFCSIFYVLPPIKYGYRGFGELGLLVNFGPTIGLGSYYVQAGSLAPAPLLISLVLGLMMWSMIVINEIPDYDEDKAGGKNTLVVRLGRRHAILLYAGGLVAAYLLLIVTVWKGIAPILALAGLISLPLAIKSLKILKNNYLHKLKMIPANLAMIKVHFLTAAGMIAGYILYLLHY